MKPIAPGTLCLIVDSRGDVYPPVIGKTTTVLGVARQVPYVCSCGCEAYKIDPVFVGELGFACDAARRHALQPILPPGVDTSESVETILPEPMV